MKISRTFKILFRQIKSKRKNDIAPIYVRITVNQGNGTYKIRSYASVKHLNF